MRDLIPTSFPDPPEPRDAARCCTLFCSPAAPASSAQVSRRRSRAAGAGRAAMQRTRAVGRRRVSRASCESGRELYRARRAAWAAYAACSRCLSAEQTSNVHDRRGSGPQAHPTAPTATGAARAFGPRPGRKARGSSAACAEVATAPGGSRFGHLNIGRGTRAPLPWRRHSVPVG